ncbi:hypothetical protein AALP_AA5G099300 [Arabis alpina]|nr:hypothetical protein AALP_AA5G099300 [Arabis alpina]
MQSIINRGPWAFNERMLVLQRWVPEMDDLALNFIPFWMQIRGIPIQFLDVEVIRNIGESFGEVKLVDFNPDVAAAVEFVRVQVNWNVVHPLKFQKNFQFTAGVNTLLKFRYERLKGFCATCGMLTHDTGECLQDDEVQVLRNNDANGDDNDGMDQQHEGFPNPADHDAIHDQQPHEVYQEGNAGMHLEDHNAGEEMIPEEVNEEESWVAFESEQAILKGPIVECSRRYFLQNLVEDIVTKSAVAVDTSTAHGVHGNGDGEGPFLEYGSFLEMEMSDHSIPSASRSHFHVSDAGKRRDSGIVRSLAEIFETGTNDLDAGPVQKKQRVIKDHVDKFVVVSTSRQPRQDALLKISDDYNEADASPPDWRSQIRGAVGPNPQLPP